MFSIGGQSPPNSLATFSRPLPLWAQPLDYDGSSALKFLSSPLTTFGSL